MDEPKPNVATILDELAILRMLLSIQESIGHLQTAIAAQARGADRQLVHQYLEYASDAIESLTAQMREHLAELQKRQAP